MKDPALRYMTLRQACEVLGNCDKRTLLNFVHSGDLIGFRLHSSGPSKWLIQEKSLVQFIQKKQKESIGAEDF